VARFTEYATLEQWWWVAFLKVAELKCKESASEHEKTIQDFVDYLADYQPPVKKVVAKYAYAKK
jgi:hypothetical protein